MKRSWIGFALLMVMLFGSLLATRQMVKIHEPIGTNLEEAARCALAEDWEGADAFFRRAEKEWKTWEPFRGCFTDHTPVEEIDGSFEMLRVYCAAREKIGFAGGCVQLARKVGAIGEAHRTFWWNLL